MTQIRVEPKPAQAPRPTLTLVPMAVVLGLGVFTTLTLSNGHMQPVDLVRQLRPIQLPALQGLKLAVLRHQTFEVRGKAWRLAEHPPVTDFAPDEIVGIGESRGFAIVANRKRGLPDLSSRPGPYDRPYLELGRGRYAPLRWRDLP